MATALKLTATKTSPTQVVAIVSLLLIAGSIYGSYQWLIPTLQASKNKLEAAQAQDSGYKTDIANLAKAKTDLSAAKATFALKGVDISRANDVVPLHEDMPGMYIQLEDLMQRGSQIVSNPGYALGVPALDPADNSVKIPLTVTATGKYADLKTFLMSLENNIRPISLSSISLTPPTATAKDASASVAPLGYGLSAIGFIRAQSLSSAYSSK